MTKATDDIAAERQKQIDAGWDDKNKGLVLDQYIGIALAYAGRATASYRNEPAQKREMLVKAAAVIAQTIDHIDSGDLSTAIPLGIAPRAEPDFSGQPLANNYPLASS